MERRTPRLLLREFAAGDAPAVLRYQSDARYQRYYAETEHTPASAEAFVRMFLDWQAESPRYRWQFVIVPDSPHEGAGLLAGNVGLRLDAPGALTGNVGYELDPEVWGHGYATEAAEEMLRFGFAELGLQRIWSRCIADNTGSRRVLERIGMSLESVQRNHEFFKERWWDQCTYGIGIEEWRASARLATPASPPAATPQAAGERAFRFETRLPLRHTDSFGGTPFVHGGVLLALTEIALDAYDIEAGVPSHRDVLRFQTHTETRYLAPLRWDDAAVVRLRASVVGPGRLAFDCEVAAASDGRTVARMTHRYAYVNAQSGRAETPEDWPAIIAAIEAYEGQA